MRTILSSPIVLASLILGCGIVTSDPVDVWELQPGTVDFYDEPIVIEHADTVSVGAAVEVTVRTYGGGCTARGPTRAALSQLTLTVEPLDSVIRPRPDLACTAELRIYDHRVRVKMPEAGPVNPSGDRQPGTGCGPGRDRADVRGSVVRFSLEP